MRNVILANARYWLRVLQHGATDGLLLPESELRGAARAIEALLGVPDVWGVTKELAQVLHPHMEQRGFWADWDDCLQVLIERARQQADAPAEAELLINRGIMQRQRDDFQGAVFSCRRAWRLYRREKDSLGVANAFSKLGDTYCLMRQFWRAEQICLAAVQLFNDGKHDLELARAESSLGLVYFDQLRYPEALPHFLVSEALFEQVGDVHGLAKVLHNLGALYRRTGNLDKALTYFEQAVQYYRTMGDEIYAARTQLDIGNIYLKQNDWLRGEATYLQVEAILRRARDHRDLAGTRLNLGIVYTRTQNWDEAEACFARALEYWRTRDDIWCQANTLGEMGELSLARGDHAKAKIFLDEAWMLVDGRTGAQFEFLINEIAERRKKLDD